MFLMILLENAISRLNFKCMKIISNGRAKQNNSALQVLQISL